MNSFDYISDHILLEIIHRYGIERETLRFLGGFRNRAYEYTKDQQQYIVRISFESQRTVGMIRGEVDWIRYLADHGVSVAKAIPSLNGEFVELVEAENTIVPVVVFEKAHGHPPQANEWNPGLFYNMGQLVGRMHRLTKEYTPKNSSDRRPLWSEEMDVFASTYLPANDEPIVEQYRLLRAYPEQLPLGKDVSGLIHDDVHRGNFFVQDGNITLFDFDDSQYSWFVEDIAIALFYAISPSDRSSEEIAYAQTFYDAFMQGYRRENTLDPCWLQEIPYFLKQREINLYIVLTSVGFDPQSSWVPEFMQGRREKILRHVPYIEIRFDEERE